MGEGKKFPVTIDSNVVGTATFLPNGEIDIEFDINLCKRHGFYDFLVAGTLKNLSIGEFPNSETKEIDNG